MVHPDQETLSEPGTTIHTDNKLDKILEAIADTRQDLRARVNAVATELSLLRGDQRKLMDRIIQKECVIRELQPSVTHLACQVRSLSSKFQELEDRAEDSEGLSHRYNLCIVGFPEGSTGADRVASTHGWLRRYTQANYPQIS
ncbi:hypothetical protein NDU88_006736 [Pleurodeles waltl]|uniref:Uncharacterized protein n=1 Tax=Pleurodeles waltl TaxID=8319 RepID=A0AAV7TZD6_PLEWA|nr:hypothetical protein NDU88_006736 [Pleurodeles waltl]